MIASRANSAYTRAAASPASNVVAIPTASKRLLISEPQRNWRDPVTKRLEELIRLEEGWDGYRGAPVSFEIAHFAVRMLEVACGLEVPVPQIVPGSQGDLQIEWHTERGDIELDVLAPNNVSAWRRNESTGPDGEELLLTNDFSQVAAWIQELTEPSRAVGTAAA
jgi:hypothetical protein